MVKVQCTFIMGARRFILTSLKCSVIRCHNYNGKGFIMRGEMPIPMQMRTGAQSTLTPTKHYITQFVLNRRWQRQSATPQGIPSRIYQPN